VFEVLDGKYAALKEKLNGAAEAPPPPAAAEETAVAAGASEPF
jgi:hypothetical protein